MASRLYLPRSSNRQKWTLGETSTDCPEPPSPFVQPKRDDDISANGLGTLLRRVSETSTREIENLIDELEGLRKKLQTDGTRIQRDIAEYAELSQQLMQLTSIIADSVKKLPSVPGISR